MAAAIAMTRGCVGELFADVTLISVGTVIGTAGLTVGPILTFREDRVHVERLR